MILMNVLFVESNPVPAKDSINLMGRPAGHVRLPLAPMKDENTVKLTKVLKELDLI